MTALNRSSWAYKLQEKDQKDEVFVRLMMYHMYIQRMISFRGGKPGITADLFYPNTSSWPFSLYDM